MSDDTSVLEHRNFCLALSIVEGQHLAHASGFSIPSEDVQKHEVLEVIAKWMLVASSGVLDEVVTCSNWFSSIAQVFNGMDDDQVSAMRMAISSFGTALIIHLLDKGLIEMDLNEDGSLSIKTMDLIRKFTQGE